MSVHVLAIWLVSYSQPFALFISTWQYLKSGLIHEDSVPLTDTLRSFVLSRIIELFFLILVRPEWSKWMDHKCTIRSEIFYLFRNGLTDVLLMSGALTVRNFLGVDLENKRADISRLLLAVSWRYLRAGFLLNSRPWEPIKKAIKIKHLRNKNSNMDNLKDNTWENVNSPIFFTWSLCSLGCGFLLGDA